MRANLWKWSWAAVPVMLLASDLNSSKEAMAVHEWGTFTSVAEADGTPVNWAPLTGPPDLPCFVETLPGSVQGSYKYMPGTVRMETPVLYFYPQKRTTVSVHVDFPQGWVTEWYPKAAVKPANPQQAMTGLGVFRNGAIDWNGIEVSPGENPALPQASGPSHYFAARATDAAPLRVNGQNEKLLFYRGVGTFQVPLRPHFDAQGHVVIANSATAPIPLAIIFENRGGRVGYRVVRDIQTSTTADEPELTSSKDALRAELVGELTKLGLYPKEAQAMVETWRDSWFEDGMRILYIYPRSAVDARLPLSISPAPSSLARVFVGRVEMLSPAMQKEMIDAIDHDDARPLVRAGRFLDSFLSQLYRANGQQVAMHPTVTKARKEIHAADTGGVCVK